MIRNYSQQDTDDLVTIWLEASLLAHSFIPADYWINKQYDMRNVYLPTSRIFVYEDDSTKDIQGFVAMNNDYLAAIFVAPHCQHKGIGKSLINRIKKEYHTITLSVYSKNISSVEFYRKQGFRIVEERIDESTGENELVMKISN